MSISFMALLINTDVTKPAKSVYQILTSPTVPDGYTRSTEDYVITTTNTSNSVSNVLSYLTTMCREFNLQCRAGQFYVGVNSKVASTHYGAFYDTGDADRWRSSINDVPLGKYIKGVANDAALAVWGDYA